MHTVTCTLADTQLHINMHVFFPENIVKAYLLRARDTIVNFKRSFTEPSSEKLLPDHLPYPYQKPYTLIIELKDVLLHSDYDVRIILPLTPIFSS